MDSCSGAGMTVGASSCPRSLSSWKRGAGTQRGEWGGASHAPQGWIPAGGRNDGWGVVPADAGTQRGEWGRNGCSGRGLRDADIAPHDHPCEGGVRPYIHRSWPLPSVRGGSRFAPYIRGRTPVRGEPVEPCEREAGVGRTVRIRPVVPGELVLVETGSGYPEPRGLRRGPVRIPAFATIAVGRDARMPVTPSRPTCPTGTCG